MRILMGILMGILIGILMMDSMGWPYDSSDCLLFWNLVEEEARPVCRHSSAVPVLQVPAGEEGGPEGFPNLLK